MAAKSPIAVAISASEIPGATAESVACDAPARSPKGIHYPPHSSK